MTIPQKQSPPTRVGSAGVGFGESRRGDHTADFRQAMAAAGIVTDDPILADGTLHRVHVDGDKRGTRNAWYVNHGDAGAFGTWRGDISQTWRADRSAILRPGPSRDELAAARSKRDAETHARHVAAQTRAVALWQTAGAAMASHPYLMRKQVAPFGIRQRDALLLIPMRDADGTLWSVQTIAPEGEKRFMFGGRKAGLFHTVGGAVSNVVLIAEGYATAATVYQATGHPIAVAFDCGNLEPVALALREKYPRARIVVCADNDWETEQRTGRNPGIEAATRAAAAVGGTIAVPPGGGE